MITLSILRKLYAWDIIAKSGVSDERIYKAFATIPRENFLPAGPWRVYELEEKQVERLVADKMLPDFGLGDTLRVHVKVAEGTRERVQVFEGVCIARKRAGLNSSFTVRKISYGEGVERVFPLYSPQIATAAAGCGGPSFITCAGGPASGPGSPSGKMRERAGATAADTPNADAEAAEAPAED